MPRILIADDDPDIRSLVGRALGALDCSVVEAANGHEAVSGFARHLPDLLLVDMIMPDKDGIEVIREIRACWPSARILAMSGMGPDSLLDKAVLLGADAILPKPFRTAELAASVQGLLPPALLGGAFASAGDHSRAPAARATAEFAPVLTTCAYPHLSLA